MWSWIVICLNIYLSILVKVNFSPVCINTSKTNSAYRNSWSLGASFGHWTLNAGLWTQDSGRWTLDAGLWTLYSGCWTVDAGLWTLDAGFWTLDSWCWTLGPGHYTLEAGLWTLNTVIVCLRTESEPCFWFCLIKLLKILWVQISIRTSWSRLFYRDYRFWRGYF